MDMQDDRKAEFSNLLEACTESLFHVALRLTNNNADAEDLVSDTALKAWLAFDSLENVLKFRPWIFRILNNCFVSRHRKKSVRPTETSMYNSTSENADGEELISLLLDQSDEFLLWWANPELELSNRLLDADIRDAIDKLPQEYRLTVILISVEGFSYDETAEVLGVPRGTVRSRMKRGRTLLQRSLWEHARDANLIGGNGVKEIV